METNGITSFIPNIQLFADAGGASTSASETTPATATTASTASTDAGNGAQTAATPASTMQTTTAQPFKSFASQADFDREIQQALKTREESIKAKLTPEIKAQLDKESKMTAEQKVQAQLDQLEADKKALAKEKNRIKAESLLVKGGITDEASRAAMLDSVVNDDETESLKRTQTLIDAISKATNDQIKAAMKKVAPPDGGTGGGSGKEKDKAIQYANEYAKRRASAIKTSNSALDSYINGGK